MTDRDQIALDAATKIMALVNGPTLIGGDAQLKAGVQVAVAEAMVKERAGAGADITEETADLHAEIEVLRRAVHTGISVIVESCAPRGNTDIDDASEIAAALHDMRAVLPDPLPDVPDALRTGGGA